jgi:transposase
VRLPRASNIFLSSPASSRLSLGRESLGSLRLSTGLPGNGIFHSERATSKMVGALVRGEPLDLPDLARVVLETLAQLVFDLQERLRTIDKQLAHWHYTNDLSNQLETIPGIGLVTASALVSSIPDPSTFRSGRHFAAWRGLVPKQNSSGGKTRLGRISKQGNKYLRQLLILGATSVLRYLRREGSQPSPWIAGLLRRRPPKVVAVARANKMAWIAWSVMTCGGEYEDKPVLRAV